MPGSPIARYEPAGKQFKALTSPVRLVIVDLLAARSRYVHELAGAMSLAW